jgi:Zn-dependent protease
MFRSWRIGKAFGIPLYVHPTLLLVPALVLADQWADGWFNVLMWTALVAAAYSCVVLHEFGHALAARAFGVRTRDITLYPIGGVARLERMPERPPQEIAVALAGPAVNLVLAGLLLPLAVGAVLLAGPRAETLLVFSLGDNPVLLAARFAYLLMASNVGLLLFNLIPAFPMDGGRVFRAVLALFLDRVRATAVASAVGLVLAGLFVLVGLTSIFTGFGTPLLALVGVFVAFAGRMELWAVRRQAEEARRAAWVQELPTERVPPLWPTFHDAGPAADFSGFRWDPRCHVWVLWRNGRPVEVYGAE